MVAHEDVMFTPADVNSVWHSEDDGIPNAAATECWTLKNERTMLRWSSLRRKAEYSDGGIGPRPQTCDNPSLGLYSLGLQHPRPAYRSRG